MTLDKDKIKQSLTIEQIFDFVSDLGGDPVMYDDFFTSITICHGGDSHKLYYYNNTHLFHCFTGCAEPSFDIFELLMKVKTREGLEWSLYKSVLYVAAYFGIEGADEDFKTNLFDWKVLDKYSKVNDKEMLRPQDVSLKVYDKRILDNFPRPQIKVWEAEGISPQVIKEAQIAYNPINDSILIPHFDIDDNLIGIRERTLAKDQEDNGKYRPAWIQGHLWNHPLSFALYNLNHSKTAIKQIKTAIIFESEKSTLLFRSYFDADISVACCGSNLIDYQVSLLLSLGVKNLIIAFDRQYQVIGDEEFKIWTKKLEKINQKYKNYCSISFIFDKGNILQYKASPIDQGKETFLQLFNERVFL